MIGSSAISRWMVSLAEPHKAMPQRALILVDIQYDFVPGGALAVPDGNSVVSVANQWIDRFVENSELVVATQDWHPPHHVSFITQNPGRRVGEFVEVDGVPQVIWPDHCVQNTHGAALVNELHSGKIQVVVQKGTDPRIDSYSGFFDNNRRKQTELADRLRQSAVRDVYILGLATDYCVKFTALDSRKLGFETWIIPDGTRAINIQPGDGEKAIAEMVDAGVRVAGMELR